MTREAEENDRKTDEKMDLLHRALKTGGGTLSPVKKASRPVEQAYEEIEQVSMHSSEGSDLLDGSPSARYESQRTKSKRSPSPSSPRSTSPRKSTLKPKENTIEYNSVRDLKRNPIMDMEEEEDASMTDDQEDTEDTDEDEEDDNLIDDQAEEDNEGEESEPPSSEGDGETLGSEDTEETASEDIGAVQEDSDDDLVPPKKSEPKASTAKSAKSNKRIVLSSEDESSELERDLYHDQSGGAKKDPRKGTKAKSMRISESTATGATNSVIDLEDSDNSLPPKSMSRAKASKGQQAMTSKMATTSKRKKDTVTAEEMEALTKRVERRLSIYRK
ncbi:hypothetical protein PIIN_11367, partial [Serendipita indica DSM 11827]